MPLSNAERQRLYRMRRDADDDRRAQYLMKKKAKYKEDIQSHKRLKVADMTARQQRQQRREWRSQQKLCRDKQQQFCRESHVEKTPVGADCTVSSSTQETTPTATTSRSRRGRKLVSRNRSSLYRENLRLRESVQKCNAKIECYRKRLQRLHAKNRIKNADTPRKATRAMMKRQNKSEIKKTLTFHHALVAQVRDKHGQAMSDNSKRAVVSAVAGQVIRKYRLLNVLTSRVGISKKMIWKVTRGIARKQNARALSEDSRQKVLHFYERDDVSRVCTGMKQTVTRHGVKKQKRLLNDSVKNTHRKFVSEGGHISYAKFCKLRPFWIVPPQETDRETCMCYMHENVRNLVNAMKNKGVLETSDLNLLVKSFMCSVDCIECAYGECVSCQTPEFRFSRLMTDDEICFWQWESGRKRYTQNGEEKEVKITVKTMKKVTEREAVAMFLEAMKMFKKHWFTMCRQFSAFRENKTNIKEDECVVHVDFSENFNCKYHSEVQAVHFGASHSQASLHTVIVYTALEEPLCLCTISENLIHSPVGIWAHLGPILDCIRKEYPQVKHLTFWSDGPSSQYKQKRNFFRLSTDPFDHGFQTVGWNFFESCHGKGAVDGVGAAIKRMANDAVRQGMDIESPRKLFDVMKQLSTSVRLMYIENDQFTLSASRTPEDVPVIQGTRSLHQINCTSKGIISHRRLSCFCEWHTLGNRMCQCYKLKEFTYNSVCQLTAKKSCHRPLRISLKDPPKKPKRRDNNNKVSIASV